VGQVDHEPVGPAIQIVVELLGDPGPGPGDHVPAAVVGGLLLEPVLDGHGQPEHHPALGDLLAEGGRHRPQLPQGQGDRVPDPGPGRPAQGVARHPGHPQLQPLGAGRGRGQPGVRHRHRPVGQDPAGGLAQQLAGQLQPLVEAAAAVGEVGPEGVELLLHPAGGHGRDQPPARQDVQADQLLEGQQGLALGHDQGRDPQPQPLGAGGQEPHRDQRLGDRPVDAGVARRHHHVVGHPPRVQPRRLGRAGRGGQPRGVGRRPVIGQHDPQMGSIHAFQATARR
jgi:hypothetical protein